MSYILDALRKSDQQRRRGAAPTLQTAQAATTAPKRPASLLNGLIAAILIGVGILIGWMRPWQAEQPGSETQPVAAKPLESSPRQAPAAVLPALPETPAHPAPDQPAQKPTPAAQPAAVPPQVDMTQEPPPLAKTEIGGTLPDAAAAVAKQAAAPLPDKPVGGGVAEGAKDQRVMAIGELPVSIQQEIPKIVISLHAYSAQPRDRLVSVNDRLLREGDFLAPGLKLDQITRAGMIFSYKGYRFARNVP